MNSEFGNLYNHATNLQHEFIETLYQCEDSDGETTNDFIDKFQFGKDMPGFNCSSTQEFFQHIHNIEEAESKAHQESQCPDKVPH